MQNEWNINFSLKKNKTKQNNIKLEIGIFRVGYEAQRSYFKKVIKEPAKQTIWLKSMEAGAVGLGSIA